MKATSGKAPGVKAPGVKAPGVKAPGVKDIAEALGIAIGTVDRALHGRAGVSAKTKAKVLRVAEELGYRPNVAARSLKLNKQIRVAVQLPDEIASFFDPLRAGIRAAAASITGINIAVDTFSYPRLGEGDLELLESAEALDYDGIIFTPGIPGRLENAIQKLCRKGTAMFCVASDAPRSERVASVSVDARISGAIAAELLAALLPAKGKVATITGELRTSDHAEKLSGFAATLALLAPHLTLLPAMESHDSPEEAYLQTSALLDATPDLSGLYISIANSIPVLRSLQEHRLLGKVRVITTDLFPELARMIEDGHVFATLYQRPYTQGKVVFETLMRHLTQDQGSQPTIRLAPHIVLKSNLPIFLEHLSSKDVRM